MDVVGYFLQSNQKIMALKAAIEEKCKITTTDPANRSLIYPGQTEVRVSPGNRLMNIILVGAGGTGSALVTPLIRYIQSNPAIAVTNLLIVDDDIVEEKNLSRQNFVKADLGKNKAEVLAQRSSKLFGMKVRSLSRRIESRSYLTELIKEMGRPNARTRDGHATTVVITTVDNLKARAIVYLAVRDTGAIWIDAGNTMYDGQALMYRSIIEVAAKIDGQLKTFTPRIEGGFNFSYLIPTMFTINPNALTGLFAETSISCADHAVSEPQTLMANQQSAMCIVNLFASYCRRLANPFEHQLMAMYFDTLTGTTRGIRYTLDDLLLESNLKRAAYVASVLGSIESVFEPKRPNGQE